MPWMWKRFGKEVPCLPKNEAYRLTHFAWSRHRCWIEACFLPVLCNILDCSTISGKSVSHCFAFFNGLHHKFIRRMYLRWKLGLGGRDLLRKDWSELVCIQRLWTWNHPMQHGLFSNHPDRYRKSVVKGVLKVDGGAWSRWFTIAGCKFPSNNPPCSPGIPRISHQAEPTNQPLTVWWTS